MSADLVNFGLLWLSKNGENQSGRDQDGEGKTQEKTEREVERMMEREKVRGSKRGTEREEGK